VDDRDEVLFWLNTTPPVSIKTVEDLIKGTA